MSDFIRVMGKTVEEAVSEALSRLSCTAEELEYNVIDEGKSGFLGLGSKPAEIEARKKVSEAASEVKTEAKEEVKAETKADTEVSVDSSSVIASAEQFLNSIFKNMGITAKLESSYNDEEKSVEINIVGEDMGNLIGKRGQTLDSLQYLTSLVVNKNLSEYVRVKLDTENYRARRKETLENLAKNIAYKVKRTKRAVKLEPMNPYERRIIHSALQDDKYVYTKSEGEEPFRHVVVLLKREKRY